MTVWCQDNNLSISKAKELVVDYRKWRAKHAPIHINGAVVERVESSKFLSVHITKDQSWSKHNNTVVKRARQRLFPLRRLKRFGIGPQILTKLYSWTIESILTGCITAWYGNCLASNHKEGSAYSPVHCYCYFSLSFCCFFYFFTYLLFT